MTAKQKLQHLLITQLISEGEVELVLPDGMTLALGITQEEYNGSITKTENYCWVLAEHTDRTVSMDRYNLEVRFLNKDGKIVVEDQSSDEYGQEITFLDVV